MFRNKFRNKKLNALLLLLTVSIALFMAGSELAMRMEERVRFNFANPVYLSNVLTAIMGGGMAGITLLKIYKLGEEEVNNETDSRRNEES